MVLREISEIEFGFTYLRWQATQFVLVVWVQFFRIFEAFQSQVITKKACSVELHAQLRWYIKMNN